MGNSDVTTCHVACRAGVGQAGGRARCAAGAREGRRRCKFVCTVCIHSLYTHSEAVLTSLCQKQNKPVRPSNNVVAPCHAPQVAGASLHAAAKAGDVEALSALLDEGKDVDELVRGWRAQTRACTNTHVTRDMCCGCGDAGMLVHAFARTCGMSHVRPGHALGRTLLWVALLRRWHTGRALARTHV